ncbi:UNVERIFIED_CONTAM: hypothetical protein K2H54_037870 [Gekko kuhli]
MPTKKAWTKGSMPRKAPRQVSPAITSSEDEGGPSLHDLAAKIEALEQAKMEKWKHVEDGASVAAPPPRGARAAAHKQERQALYARLVQLQESEDEEDTQELSGGGTRFEDTGIAVCGSR